MPGKMLAYAVVAVTLLGAGGVAAETGGHDSHGAAHSELVLNNGRQWPTDTVLRSGMTEIRALMAKALPKIHADSLPPSDYARLANDISNQIHTVTAGCKLPADADAQLHLVLARIIDGTEHMTLDGKRQDGAMTVMAALETYGRYFAHPGWHPLAH